MTKQNLRQTKKQDVSDQKKTERELIRAKEHAERADRLKSNFLAQMSHEIRTPINTILNFTTLVRNDLEPKLNKDNLECFNSIESGANRLMRTIDLVLNISDIEAGTYQAKFTKIDVFNEVLEPLVAEFRRTAELNKIELKLLTKFTKNPVIKIDHYTFSQIIANLIDNAIKYTEVGSVTLILDDAGPKIGIKIIDSGIGISEKYLPNLFKKFTQEESGYTRRFEGTGLGLALVKKYCKINNIDISVESEKGKGTTFLLQFNEE